MALITTEQVRFESSMSASPAYRVSSFDHEGTRRVLVRCWERPASEGRHESQAATLNLKESSLAAFVAALGKAQKALEGDPPHATEQMVGQVEDQRLVEVEAALLVATARAEFTDRQYHEAGLASVKAEGPGGSRGTVMAAQGALHRAEDENREARAAVNDLSRRRAQLKREPA